MAFNTITVRPAAGPLTPNCEPLSVPTKTPPTIPAITPEISGAPEAKATPKQSGKATKNTTKPDGKSDLIYLKFNNDFIISLLIFFVAQFSKLLCQQMEQIYTR